jgi:hypothetical protein
MPSGRDSSLLYLGIFLVSSAALILEISLTRVFSVSKWYHFAFLVVSIALVGYGASGSFLAISGKTLKKDMHQLLAAFSLLFSVSCLVGFLATNNLDFDPFTVAWDSMQWVNVALHYLFLAMPFFFAGACVATAISKLTGEVNKIYFSDLLGAGVGSLAVVFIASYLPAQSMVVFAALGGAAASFVFTRSRKFRLGVGLWIVLLSLAMANPALFEIQSSPYKSINVFTKYPGSEILMTKWNSFSKVDVVRSPVVRYAPGLSYRYGKPLPEQLAVTVDNDGSNAITRYDDASLTEFLPDSLAYGLQDEEPRALIMGAGGGMDIMTALHHNASSVTVVERNSLVIDAVKIHFSDFAGNIYNDKRVTVINSEPRGFVESNPEKYDVIQLSLQDNLLASSTGLYGMSESYLYTTEAFETYMERLSDGGVLSVTRWLLYPPRQEVRLVSLAVDALKRRGVENPGEHIVIIRTWTTLTLLVKKTPLTDVELQYVREFSEKMSFDLVYIPGIQQSEVNVHSRFSEPYYYNTVNDILSENREGFYRNYLFDVSPSYDDKPFFFNFFRWDKIGELYESLGRKWEPFFEGGFLAVLILVQALLLSGVFIAAPLLFARKLRLHRILWYFLLIGIAYMFIEIAMIQKFILFLGEPVYAISVILFSVLVSSGLGAYYSRRLGKHSDLMPVMLGISAIILLYLALLPVAFDFFIGSGLPVKYAASFVLLFPLGFLMGMPFPTGIKLANKLDKKLVPWAWCVNGCASVTASVAAVIIALSSGFSLVFVLAGIAYMGAVFILVSALPRS